MHILVTDILTCPVCGPAHGLIVRTDRIEDRRVVDGALGCPACRRTYPIHERVAVLAPDGPGPELVEGPAPADPIRMAALLGLAGASGFALILGPAAALAGRVAELVPPVEILADARAAAAADGVSPVHLGSAWPFYDGRLRGIWLSGEARDTPWEEAARALHPLGRLVREPVPGDAAERAAANGLRVLARDESTMVAARA